MKTRSNSGFGDPATLLFIAGVAAGVFLGNWRPLQGLFGKEPPTAQLNHLQSELERARAEASATEASLRAAQSDERSKLEAQVRAAQQDNAGAAESLQRVPSEHQTAEVKLAAAMTQRVSLKLASAIGKLPPDQQEAMVLLIDQALSGKQAEIDEANRKLAERDAAFAELTAERDTLRLQTIPAIQADAETAKRKADTLHAQVVDTTAQLQAWVRDKQASDAANHSLRGTLDRIINLAVWGAVIWACLVFVLPGLVKHLGPGRLKTALRNLSGYAANPLLYHDAKRKLAESSASQPAEPQS